MLLSFRGEGAAEESSASTEDLEFQAPKNTSEGAEHFTLFLFREGCNFLLYNQNLHLFQPKNHMSGWMLHQEAWRPLGVMYLKETCEST